MTRIHPNILIHTERLIINILNKKMTFFLKKYADQIGIAASSLCLVHCLLMPVLMAVWLEKDTCVAGGKGCIREGGFNYDYLFLAFSGLAIWLASGHCQKQWLKRLMWTCFGLLTAGVLLEPHLAGAHLATFPAAIGLAVAHLLNWQTCRHCNPAHHHLTSSSPQQP